jgi:transposase
MGTFQIPLDIPDVEVLHVERNKVDDYIITVRSTNTSTRCNICGQEATKIHGYAKPLLLRHLPILGNQVYIRIKPVRYCCTQCDNAPTTTEQPEWYTRKSQMTHAYEEHLMRTLIGSTIQDVSRKEDIGYDSVKAALNRQIETEPDWDSFSELKLLGLDEIALKKGHKDFIVIVSTHIDGVTKIITVLPNRLKTTVKSFLENIPQELKKTVKTVCSDMYDGYINAAKEVFGKRVQVVVDRFHVAKSYRKCVDSLRKQELKRLKKELTDEEYKKLKGAMWALRKKEEDLTEEEDVILKNLFNHSKSLEIAYTLQNSLTDIFNQDYGKNKAAAEIKAWIREVKESELVCYEGFISSLEMHWDEILNYFYRQGRKNSGFVEGLNNKIKVIKRRCYGMLNVKSLYQRIYLDLEGYQLFVYS